MIILTVFLFKGKGSIFIAGFNTMSQKEKTKYLSDRGLSEKELSRKVGKILLPLSIATVIMGFAFFLTKFILLFSILYAITVIVSTVYGIYAINRRTR